MKLCQLLEKKMQGFGGRNTSVHNPLKHGWCFWLCSLHRSLRYFKLIRIIYLFPLAVIQLYRTLAPSSCVAADLAFESGRAWG